MLPFNFNHLYYFYIVAKCGSFSRAADDLRVSQSSISVQIQQFEKSLGHRFFDRVKTGVTLTEPGHIMFTYADSVFSDVDRLLSSLREMEHTLRGSITVGTVNSIGIYLLPELLKHFSRVHPDVRVGIDFKRPKELVDSVRAGRLDFVVLTSQRRYTGLTGVPLQKNKMFLVAPPEHPLIKQDTISLGDLEGYPFLGFEEGMQTRSMMDALFRRMSLSIEYAMESSNVATIKHMAMAGLGLAILPEPVVAPEIRQGLLVRPDLPSLYLTQEITLYYKTNRAMTAEKREFLKAMQRELDPAATRRSDAGPH